MVKLYTSSRVKKCPFCEKARNFMSRHSIQYEEIDCATDKQSWNEMFKKTKEIYFPQLLVGKDTFVGWVPAGQEHVIEELFKKNNIGFGN